MSPSGSAVLESTNFLNSGTLSVPEGASLQLTNAPANLKNSTLTGGIWKAAGTLSLPGTVVTLAASVTLSGSGEIEDSINSANVMDTLSKITSAAIFTLNNSAYLGTGSVTSSGKVILGTKGNAGDSVNWQDSGTFTMTSGTFTFLDPNACINVGSRAFNITGGTMSGFGMLTGTTTVSGAAVFAPTLGSAQATFWLDGTFTQTGGTFEDVVTNPSGTPSAGYLWVSGGVTLGGNLLVVSNGARPATGTSLEIASGDSVAGSFSSVKNVGVAGFSVTMGAGMASIVAGATAPPSAPRSLHAALATSHSAKVTWKSPASNGGDAVTGYVLTPQPACSCSGLTAGPSATSAVVKGLTAGKKYTFVAQARNAVGTGPASAATNVVG
jgi:hypothetical protein